MRLVLGDDAIDDPAWLEGVAELVADALLMKFRVRERTAADPRYRWRAPAQGSWTAAEEP